ncbi:uncharacterized protein LOC109420663 [Aedes albopictus]|uniref:CCHC-type domain-containing protein n=1 Tax=Aedes albopictus TaxID=7160 RepID=A0ABM1Z7Z9_AEDAL
MDSEMQVKYKTLLVHHLDKQEVEFELDVRAVPFEKTESVGVLRRRLREALKDKGEQVEVDFSKCANRTVDEEIKVIDHNVEEIRDFLEKKKNFEGIKDSLRTRLVHYFARCSAIQGAAEEDVDLEDLDKLLSTVRQLYNTYFSLFTPVESIRKEVMLQISNSLTQLQLAQPGTSGVIRQVQSRSQETQTEDDLGSQEEVRSKQSISRGSLPRRQLRSSLEPARELSPMMSFPSVVQQPSVSGLNSRRSLEERVLNRIDLSGRNRNLIGKGNTSEKESDSSSSQSPPSRRRSRHRRSNVKRSRPVSDWNLRYDGRDGGQGLMRFIKEVDFYAKSENISEKELFRSAIHLFAGAAKIWFMAGVENGDFSTWKDLVSEMKREFLSPDHDHVSEFRAIERKQRPKEKFQDFFFDLQKLFNSLTKPISERKKFEIVFRNLRADYKGYVVAANIDNLADLKPFGRKLDATFWYKYENRNTEENASKNRNQVGEMKVNAKPKSAGSVSRPDKPRSDQKPPSKVEEEKVAKQPSSANQQGDESQGQSSSGVDKGLQAILEKYTPPKPGVCYNCRLSGHHQADCDRPKHKFCFRCGFFNFDTKNCPFCAKNA